MWFRRSLAGVRVYGGMNFLGIYPIPLRGARPLRLLLTLADGLVVTALYAVV